MLVRCTDKKDSTDSIYNIRLDHVTTTMNRDKGVMMSTDLSVLEDGAMMGTDLAKSLKTEVITGTDLAKSLKTGVITGTDLSKSLETG